MQIKIAILVNTVVLGILAGLTFCVQLGLIPVLNSFDASSYTKVMQGIIPPLTAAAKPMMVIGSISFLIRFVKQKVKWTLSHYCIMLGFLFFIAGGIITLVGNFPINNRIMTWSTENPPAAWQSLREKWNQFNLWRFVFAQISFIAGLTPLLFYRIGALKEKGNAASNPAIITL